MAQYKRPNLGDLSEPELRELKRERLQYTIEYAQEHSPFYKELFRENNVVPERLDFPANLEQLPITDSDDLLANQPPETEKHRLWNTDANTRRPFHTSGTTGEPKTIFRSYDEMNRIYDAVRRGHRHFGMTSDDVVVNMFPFIGLNVSGFGTEGGMEDLGVETIPIGNTPYPPEREFAIIERLLPPTDGNYVLTGLGSHIDAKAMQFLDVGRDPAELGFDLVIIAGEPVSGERKTHLEDVFDATVYEYLGSTEGGAFAFECKERKGLHVLDDFVHVEVIDPDTGEQVEAGEEGQLVITPLIPSGNESATPLVRYHLGDLTTKIADSPNCACELQNHTLITQPRREGSNFIVGAVNLTPLFIEEQIYDHAELRNHVHEYQIELDYEESTGRDVLRVLIECDNELTPDDAFDIKNQTLSDSIGAELGHKLLQTNSHLQDTVNRAKAVRIDVQFVEELDVGRGKPERVKRLQEQ